MANEIVGDNPYYESVEEMPEAPPLEWDTSPGPVIFIFKWFSSIEKAMFVLPDHIVEKKHGKASK